MPLCVEVEAMRKRISFKAQHVAFFIISGVLCQSRIVTMI